jgi:elongation factor P--beta-lysine ligase
MSNTNTLKINKSNINQDKLRSFAQELTKDVKTQDDLADLSSALLKMTVEAALGTEIEHLLDIQNTSKAVFLAMLVIATAVKP